MEILFVRECRQLRIISLKFYCEHHKESFIVLESVNVNSFLVI